MFGLETNAFVFLMIWGTHRLFDEHHQPDKFPWSGVIFAIGGLTRPEAPLFIGIPMLMLGKGLWSRQNLIRCVLFVVPLMAHLAWRYGYYGSLLPSTLDAKTGDLRSQLKAGRSYVLDWVDHCGLVLFIGFYGIALGLVKRHRELITIALVLFAVLGYVVLVGGDWMSYFRFLTPAEPYAFLLVGVATRELWQTHNKAAWLALAFLGHMGRR